MSRSSLSPIAMLAIAMSCAAPVAHAAVIASNTAGTTGSSPYTDSARGFGQSVTTSSSGPWNTISFNFSLAADQSPAAWGTLYLLSSPYAGTVAALSSATPGYVADTSTITGGAWDFDDAVTLQADTQYFFYTASGGVPLSILFSLGNPYPGGILYEAIGANFGPLTGVDFAFSLQGNQVTATPEPASALLLAPALLALLRTRRRPA